MTNNVKEVMSSFAEDVFDIEKSFREPLKTKSPKTEFDSFLDQFVEQHVGERVTRIYSTTRKRVIKKLKSKLRESLLEEGTDVDTLSNEVENIYKGFTASRAMTIARTETHNASMNASLKAAKNLEIPGMKKEWVPVQDERTRRIPRDSADHLNMSGSKVGIEEKFEVPSSDGVDMMNGPGDLSAPADQIIHCRCALVYSSQ